MTARAEAQIRAKRVVTVVSDLPFARVERTIRPAAKRAGSEQRLPAAPKVQTTIFGYGGGRGVRRDFVGGRETGFSWGGAGTGAGEEAGAADEAGEGEDSAAGGGKKKGKGKKGKNVLVAWG